MQAIKPTMRNGSQTSVRVLIDAWTVFQDLDQHQNKEQRSMSSKIAFVPAQSCMPPTRPFLPRQAPEAR